LPLAIESATDAIHVGGLDVRHVIGNVDPQRSDLPDQVAVGKAQLLGHLVDAHPWRCRRVFVTAAGCFRTPFVSTSDHEKFLFRVAIALTRTPKRGRNVPRKLDWRSHLHAAAKCPAEPPTPDRCLDARVVGMNRSAPPGQRAPAIDHHLPVDQDQTHQLRARTDATAPDTGPNRRRRD
jgi:hypothetical protein